jgi:GTP pyrophosphokinase
MGNNIDYSGRCIMSNSNVKAYELAVKSHAGQKRGTGEDYITHPVSVVALLMNKGYYGDYVSVGYLHDVMEDSNTTWEEIKEATNAEVADAVYVLTKPKDYDMMAYLNRICYMPLAYPVKLADRIHNLCTSLEMDKKFRIKYRNETEEYYLPLAKDSVFYRDMLEAFNALDETL